jgi:small-conductance mechanosensitive channel
MKCSYCKKEFEKTEGSDNYCSDECRDKKRQIRHNYYVKNKSKIAAQNKKWRENNKDSPSIKRAAKNYNETHKEQNRIRYKNYRDKLMKEKPQILDNILNQYITALKDLDESIPVELI